MSLIIFLFSFLFIGVVGWVQWGYEENGPGSRAEHSLLIFNDTVYMFGGRGNTEITTHDPRTFSTERVNGTVLFTSYSQKHVVPCLDESGNPRNIKSLSPEDYKACYQTLIGKYRNDVWSYNLNCSRVGDMPCLRDTWRPVVPGALLGGCRNYDNSVHCTHPQERYGQAAAILYEGAPRGLNQERAWNAHLLVYGGAAQLCEDYCSDMWSLNLTQCSLNNSAYAGCKWKEVGVLGRSGPGKRWRSASAHDNTRWVIFGGHRVWQGMTSENDASNDWGDFTSASYGGYLDDLWVYTWSSAGLGESVYKGLYNNGTGFKAQYGARPGAVASAGYTDRELSLAPPVRLVNCTIGDTCLRQGAWTQVLPREECFHDPPPGVFDARNDITCKVKWPPARAMGALALGGELLYLYGGYRVYAYPYPHTMASGNEKGVLATKSDGTIAFPGKPQFLGDLWVFDWTSGLWAELSPSVATGFSLPLPRRGHSLLFAGAALLLQGGFSYGNYLSDLWIYNISRNHWLKQTIYPYPDYSDNCTSNVDSRDSPYSYTDVRTGELLFYKDVVFEPTRGTPTDGKFGRASGPVLVPGSRRRAFGWDGCRDRADGRVDLAPGINFKGPTQRSDARSVWSERYSTMILFGGEALSEEKPISYSSSQPSSVVGDTWAWSSGWCPANCSGVGSCVWGHCYCNNGFYGEDCSNKTCGGSYCTYDTDNHVQNCRHCCAAGWIHSDGEDYRAGVIKLPCDATHPGETNGVCDGFSQCICAPPYLGPDCSIKDCPNNCTSKDRGYCSVEFPVSRCVCSPPYSGMDCSIVTCLNNCSYPNGLCDLTSGICKCRSIPNPYDKSQEWSAYEGDDCSFVPAFCGAGSGSLSAVSISALVIAVLTALHF